MIKLKNILAEKKQPINESKGDIPNLANIFARFVIGDRETAIKQLQKEIKNDYGIDYKYLANNPSEFNKVMGQMEQKMTIAIKQAL